MKKQGFTLIELLAVIVIMGILMFAAIPAINRTIENARKDQFINLAQNYARAVETLWQTDGLECKSGAGTSYQVASALPKNLDDNYYVLINTSSSDTTVYPKLLQQGGKSPWGNSDIVGFIQIWIGLNDNVEFYPVLKAKSYVLNPTADDSYEYLGRRNVFNFGEDWDLYDEDDGGWDFSSMNNYKCIAN